MNPESKEMAGYNNPGPGTYDGDYQVGRNKKPQFSFGKDIKRDNDRGVPGPGAYDGHGVDTKASIAVSKEPRDLKYGNAYPGPGTYDGDGNIKFDAGNKYSFGKDKRGKDLDRQKVGPGDYDIPHSIPDVATYNYPAKDKRKIHL